MAIHNKGSIMTKKPIHQDDDAQGAPEVIANTVPMVRLEDRSAEPVIAQVAPADVDHWKSHGWSVKE
jgi:hypothetical protein